MNETDSSANDNDEALGLRQIKAVYVYDAPVRFWHLTNGVSIDILTIMKKLSSPQRMKDTVREAAKRGRSIF